MGHQRGQAVVVAEADLVIGHRVVLVHDRDHAQLQLTGKGLAGVEVLAAVDEVEGCQQDLTAHQPVARQLGGVDGHEPDLAHGGDGLQGGQVGGPVARQSQRGEPGGDGPRAHHDDPVPVAPQPRHLGAELVDGLDVDLAVTIGHRGRAYLHHDDHRVTSVAASAPPADPVALTGRARTRS